jgi:hypothetical protein
MGSGERDGKQASFNGAAEGNRGGVSCSRFAVRSAPTALQNHTNLRCPQGGGYS